MEIFFCVPITICSYYQLQPHESHKTWEIAHVWECEGNSQTAEVTAYLMQYLLIKFYYFFFSSEKENSKGKQQFGGGCGCVLKHFVSL